MGVGLVVVLVGVSGRVGWHGGVGGLWEVMFCKISFVFCLKAVIPTRHAHLRQALYIFFSMCYILRT